MKINRFYFCLFLFVTTICFDKTLLANNYRNISTFTSRYFSYGDTAEVYENAFIARAYSNLSFLLKFYRDDRYSWANNILTFGPIVNLDKHHYLEVTYGFGVDSNDGRSDHFGFEITREKSDYLVGIGYRFVYLHSDFSYHLISPSGKYYIMPKLSLWGKYFLSIDSDDTLNHAYWFETEYLIYKPWLKIKAGFTRGNRLFENEFDREGRGKFYSLLGGLSFQINQDINIKYIFEYLDKITYYSEIKNIFIVDIRF